MHLIKYYKLIYDFSLVYYFKDIDSLKNDNMMKNKKLYIFTGDITYLQIYATYWTCVYHGNKN